MDKSKKKLILNVDDVEAGRYAITRSLLQAGFEVVEATNGSDALKLAEERPDLILLDVNLPDLDGRKVCKMIKANPYTSSIPVVHLSATFVQSEERAEGLEGGADGYLVQPVDPRVLVATIRSLLRLKEAEQSLREMQEWLQAAVSAANVGLWDWDLRTNQIYFSPEWKRQIGYEAYELSNDLLEWQKRIHPDDLDRILQTIQAYIANPESHYQTEFRFRHKDGSYRWILTQASLLFDEQDQPVRMLGSHLDITDQKELEAEKEALAAQFHQAQKMESIGRLAGGIAHHFNNLLVPIIGFAELGMGQVAADSQLHADLGRIKSAAERAAYLTKQILAFSRQQILELKILDLNQVILEFQNMLQHLIGEDIALQTQFAQNLDPIMADKGQLQHVLLNLAVNARDAMPNGGTLIIETANVMLDEAYVSQHTGAQPGHHVMLAVSDSGPGLDAATQQRIFEPFFNTRAQGQDSGLGMATVYGIVKQHKGNILVYSEPGQGTIFKIYFPLANAPISNTVPEYPAAGSFHGTETVLVVEDEPSVRQLVCNTLRAHGYGVLEAGDSEKALAVAAEHDDPIHLLLTDVTLPRMNGLILYKKLIEEYSGLRVLYISAYTRNVIAHRYGLDDRAAFLQKPFSMYHLLQNMRAVIEKT